MKAYLIRLGHIQDGKVTTQRYIVNGLSQRDAVDSVLHHTGAPYSAVMSWEEADAATVKEWRKELGL